MKIPVFHDDQHGTAIIVGAAILNGLKVVGKDLKKCKLVVSGAGAAALACLDLIVDLGFPIENIFVTDLAGVVYKGRKELMDPDKERFAQDIAARTLAEVIPGADIFLGLSAGGVLKPEMVRAMAERPLVLALANPTPEILPEEVREVRDDAVIATGRSDYPNQVNNVLCFPYIFRGALDCGATTITRTMEIATVHAIAELAQAEQSDVVATTYGVTNLAFGADYIIPKPFDPRLMLKIAPAVALAAQKSGVAQRPIKDIAAYTDKLQQFVYHSGSLMKPVFAMAKKAPAAKKRIVFAEGEEERYGLRLRPEIDFDVINPERDDRYRSYWETYLSMTRRKGITEQYAKLEMRRRHTLIGSMAIHKGDADGMICGTFGTVNLHLHYIDQVLGRRAGVNTYAAMNALVLPDRQVVLVDTHVNETPTAEQIAEITIMAAEEMRRFGLHPRAALLSHSNFGSSNSESACRMREALSLIRARAPELEVDGEMHGDVALDAHTLRQAMPDTPLKGDANLLVFSSMDSANIAYNLLKVAAGNGVAIGPVLLGCARAVHVLTPSATVRRIVNMTALAVVDAVSQR